MGPVKISKLWARVKTRTLRELKTRSRNLKTALRKRAGKLFTWLEANIAEALHRRSRLNIKRNTLLKATFSFFKADILKLNHNGMQYIGEQNVTNRCFLTASLHLLNFLKSRLQRLYKRLHWDRISSSSVLKSLKSTPRYFAVSTVEL